MVSIILEVLNLKSWYFKKYELAILLIEIGQISSNGHYLIKHWNFKMKMEENGNSLNLFISIVL